MRARIKPGNTLTNKQRDDLAKYIHIEVEKHLKTERDAATRRMFKLMAISLNGLYEFGAGRTSRLIADISERLEADDPVFWAHVDRRLHQIGLEFKDEDWKEGFS